MANLLAQLAKGMIFAHRNFTEMQRKISLRKFSRYRRTSHICEFDQNLISRGTLEL